VNVAYTPVTTRCHLLPFPTAWRKASIEMPHSRGLTAGDEPVLRGRKLAELSGYLHTRSMG
jgi:hypothetical protein